MKRQRRYAVWLALFLLGTALWPARAGPSSAWPGVTLSAASGARLRFWTQNGRTVGGIPPRPNDLPYLVLYRNGALTPAVERTLRIQVTGLEVPPLGAVATLVVETQHGDPAAGPGMGQRITVWRASRWLPNPSPVPLKNVSIAFAREFGATAGLGRVATPTDYYRYVFTLTNAENPPSNPLYVYREDYAFLLENQWRAPLPEVQEATLGAAPDELIIYYCDMFPFYKDGADPATRVPREAVTAYVGGELAPRMVEAFRVQTDVWGFPWYPTWASLRQEDGDQLGLALTAGETWFHGRAPMRGRSGMSIQVSGGYAEYETLTDGLMAVFHHELFHSHQRNLYLHLASRPARQRERGGAWPFFVEGTATLAASVGQPGIEFAQAAGLANAGPWTRGPRNYVGHANRFLPSSASQTRYRIGDPPEANPYSAALYWRFLYELCGGMSAGAEHSGAGMGVIRRALTVLYSEDVVSLGASFDHAGDTAKILDRALAGSSCPFETYEASVRAFSRAVYALRLEGGRCTGPGVPEGCGLYDPHYVYQAPPVRTTIYNGDPAEVRHELMDGLGTDLHEVSFAPTAEGRSLSFVFSASPAVRDELDVQILPLQDNFRGVEPRHTPIPSEVTRIRAQRMRDGRVVYVIPRIRRAAYDRLAVIVTRAKAEAWAGVQGEYTIELYPSIGP